MKVRTTMKTFFLILTAGLIAGCHPGYSDSDTGLGSTGTRFVESESLKTINTLSSVGRMERLKMSRTGKYEILTFTTAITRNAANDKVIETTDVAVECGTYTVLGPLSNQSYHMTPDSAPADDYGLIVLNEPNPSNREKFVFVKTGYTDWMYYTSHNLRLVTVASTLPRCNLN